jgi:Dihaem cytochrome c
MRAIRSTIAAGAGLATLALWADDNEHMWRATRDQTPPLRITETDYFLGQHYEIPAKMVTENPEVKSFSRCAACHTQADQGSFNEHQVRVPGYGRFED